VVHGQNIEDNVLVHVTRIARIVAPLVAGVVRVLVVLPDLFDLVVAADNIVDNERD